ncbi:hypothetical protein GJ689_19595 [Rhodoplanes serenus]|uniref:Transposase TnpC homeodomain domain-containing protein n=1 Tax=Rhodoplanes serenus TaxID=200615 RepID=A0A9X5AUH5_9BRAD|nr:hypothetical protein [Rhodoplanes serenus]
MRSTDSPLPDDVETLKRLVLTRDAELALARAEMSSAEALIAHLRLAIEKMRRELYGQRSERKARLLDQMELSSRNSYLPRLRRPRSRDGERGGRRDDGSAAHRKTPAGRPFPAHLPRERVAVPGPTTCTCCGSGRLAKLGEDVTETLESVPRRWKVVQIVRSPAATARRSARRRRRSMCCRAASPGRACSP